jgi:hypothetical protein
VKTVHCTVGGTYVIDNPKLAPLAFNGGPTRTHALLDGSPAIDNGIGAACVDDMAAPLTRDQRGVQRPWGAACDIGAFERQPDLIFNDGFGP